MDSAVNSLRLLLLIFLSCFVYQWGRDGIAAYRAIKLQESECIINKHNAVDTEESFFALTEKKY